MRADAADGGILDGSVEAAVEASPADDADAALNPFADYDPFGDQGRNTADRPPPKSTDSSIADSSLDGGTESSAENDGAVQPEVYVPPPCTTTECVLAAQGPDCLECARTLDNEQASVDCFDTEIGGGRCEDFPDAGPGANNQNESQVCLAALQTIIQSKCGASGQLTPCVCGSADTMACYAGRAQPDGPLYDLYSQDFGTENANAIVMVYFTQPKYGAGLANAIANCLNAKGCSSCLADAPMPWPDAGARDGASQDGAE
jgi:hypothetical protein